MHVKYDDKPLYNSRIIISYIKLLETRYPHVNIRDLIKSSGMERYQIEDEGHWFTQKQINLFHQNLNKLVNNKNIARDAGRFAASSYVVGTMKGYIMGLLGPAKTYELLSKVSKRFTRSSKYQAKKITSNKVEITVTPYPGVKEESFQCENRIGYFEAMLQFFNYKPPKITHPQCIFKGDSFCRYIAHWQVSKVTVWRRIRNVLVFLFILFDTAAFFAYPLLFFKVFSLSMFVILILNLFLGKMETDEIKSALFSLRDSSEELLEQININYKNSMIINEIGQAAGSQYDLSEVLQKIIGILRHRLEYDRGMILLANDDKSKLIFRSGYGYNEQELNSLLDEDGFRLTGNGQNGVSFTSFMKKIPILIDDIEDIERGALDRDFGFAHKIGTAPFIACPITFENEAFGIIIVDNIKSGRVMLQRDVNILSGIAGQIGFIINNINLIAMLNQAQKMEAIGTLAAGIAHDFNNILSSILGFSTLARDKLEAESPAGNYINNVITAAERAKELVRHISTFSRQTEKVLKPLLVRSMVNEALVLIRSSFPSTIEIKENIDIKDDYIIADPTQILQVIMNLFKNAADAINGREGTITVSLDHVSFSSHELPEGTNIEAGEYIKLTISDTGSGIKENVKKRIFEPFFTTKDIGKGTGMGLAVVHGIVKSHGGGIRVSSKYGEGTAFDIYLPKSDKKAEMSEQNDVTLSWGNESILFVDDEEDIVFLGEKILEGLGYNVTALSESLKALDIFRKSPEKFDLVITDLTMPGITGLKLMEEIRLIRPSMPFILCTGYREMFPVEKNNANIELLLKPISRNELAETVRKVLDKNN